MEKENKPKVGVGIMILKEGKVLLGKRKSSHGSGQYAFPGGHFEYMESFEQSALRELSEECGIKIQNLRFQFLANLTEYTPKHYVHVGLIAEWKSGEPEILEPEKCDGWNWYNLDNLPSPLFKACELAFESYKTGFIFKDSK
ncbi:MAG: hypothetical protein RLY57_464 [Candidatus Parcubacteria bacterium]|jgi:8-oxo-dGTP diphosphatase